jgi:hypothetical protein
MASYILPQVVINQLFSEVALNTIKNQNCLVFGPNFQLFRYKDENVRDTIHLGHYDGSSVVDELGYRTMEFDYPDQPSGSTVDTGYTKLFADDAVVKIATVTGFTKLDDDEAGADLDGRLRFNVCIAGKFRPADSSTDDYIPRDIVVGDVIRIKGSDGEYFKSTILEVFASDKSNPEAYDSVRIADTIPGTVPMEEDSAGQETFDGEIEFCASVQNVEVPERSEVPGEWQWKSTEEKFEILTNGENLTIEYLGARRQVIEAELYLEYRAFLLGATDTIHSIEKSSDVAAVLGEITPDNPLAFGVSKCASNSADRVVYYMATADDSRESYARVLDAASKTDDVYFLVPLTQNDDVIDDVKAHVEEMSKGVNKLWRVAFVCSEVPEVNVLYTKAASTDGKGFFAVFEPPMTKPKAGNIIMKFVESEGDDASKPSSATKCASQVVSGDTVRLFTGATDPWTLEPLYDTYTVDKVLSNTVLRLKNGPKEAVAAGVRVEVVHEYTYQEKTTAIASTSRALMSRRMYNVFPTWAQESDGTVFNGVHLAAAAAGLASSVLPQQPITNVELTGIDDVPVCYETYSRTQLNEIAEGGTFIIMQDLPGDRVYIRHQISTEYSSNNLLKSELSITKNLDSISYYFAEAYKPYIGRYNITPGLLEVLRSVAEEALTKLETETGAGLYGPQILPDGTEISQLYQDPVNQDHVYMHLKLNLPRPFNVLDLDLEVI